MPFKFNKLKRNQPAWFNEESLSATEANIYIYRERERERTSLLVPLDAFSHHLSLHYFCHNSSKICTIKFVLHLGREKMQKGYAEIILAAFPASRGLL